MGWWVMEAKEINLEVGILHTISEERIRFRLLR